MTFSCYRPKEPPHSFAFPFSDGAAVFREGEHLSETLSAAGQARRVLPGQAEPFRTVWITLLGEVAHGSFLDEKPSVSRDYKTRQRLSLAASVHDVRAASGVEGKQVRAHGDAVWVLLLSRTLSSVWGHCLSRGGKKQYFFFFLRKIKS